MSILPSTTQTNFNRQENPSAPPPYHDFLSYAQPPPYEQPPPYCAPSAPAESKI